jgi:hypothetical protein
MYRTSRTRAVYGEWAPGRWLRRIKPSNMKFEYPEDLRCVRCGVWPDQSTGNRARWDDWFEDDWFRLCPGCYERVMFAAVRSGRDWTLEAARRRWPHRGRSKPTE